MHQFLQSSHMCVTSFASNLLSLPATNHTPSNCKRHAPQLNTIRMHQPHPPSCHTQQPCPPCCLCCQPDDISRAYAPNVAGTGHQLEFRGVYLHEAPESIVSALHPRFVCVASRDDACFCLIPNQHSARSRLLTTHSHPPRHAAHTNATGWRRLLMKNLKKHSHTHTV